MKLRLSLVLAVVAAGSWLCADAPVLQRIIPDVTTAGAHVYVKGSNFSETAAENVVTLTPAAGDPVVLAAEGASSRYLKVLLPEDLPPGEYGVTVRVGEETSDPPAALTIIEAGVPYLESIRPATGWAGNSVTLSGRYLGDSRQEVTVKFGEVEITGTVSRRTVCTSVPEGLLPEGTEALEVLVSVVVGEVESNQVPFTVIPTPPPVIEELHPDRGPAGRVVYIVGEHLCPRRGLRLSRGGEKWGFDGDGAGATVLFGSESARVLFCTSRVIAAVVPGGLVTEGEAVVDVTVVVGGETSNALPFTVLETPVPVVESLDPVSGTVGTSVRIKGQNLGGLFAEVAVVFGEGDGAVPADRVFAFDRGRRLQAVVPAELAPGVYQVTVTVNGIAATLAEGAAPLVFTVELPPTPVIEAIDPAAGPVGTRVKITGENLWGWTIEPTVRFGDVPAEQVSRYRHHRHGDGDGSALSVVVPEGLSLGTYSVTVDVGGSTSDAVDFEVTDTPADPGR